jgi:hypothetical protein
VPRQGTKPGLVTLGRSNYAGKRDAVHGSREWYMVWPAGSKFTLADERADPGLLNQVDGGLIPSGGANFTGAEQDRRSSPKAPIAGSNPASGANYRLH